MRHSHTTCLYVFGGRVFLQTFSHFFFNLKTTRNTIRIQTQTISYFQNVHLFAIRYVCVYNFNFIFYIKYNGAINGYLFGLSFHRVIRFIFLLYISLLPLNLSLTLTPHSQTCNLSFALKPCRQTLSVGWVRAVGRQRYCINYRRLALPLVHTHTQSSSMRYDNDYSGIAVGSQSYCNPFSSFWLSFIFTGAIAAHY